MPKLHSLLLLLAPFSVSGAQTQGFVTESRIVSQKNDSAPDTVFTHLTSAGRRGRNDVSGPGSTTEPWRSFGTTQIMVQSDTASTVTYLDSARKTYWMVDLRSTVAQFRKSVTVDVEPVTSGDTLVVDSLGAGGLVDGHSTIHFQTHLVTRLTVTIMDESTSTIASEVTDYYVAPDLHIDEDRVFTAGAPGVTIPSGTVSPSMKALVAKRTALFERMAKSGSVIRTVARSTVTSGSSTTSQRTTTDVLSQRRVSVPDSVFALPAGYVRTGRPQV